MVRWLQSQSRLTAATTAWRFELNWCVKTDGRWEMDRRLELFIQYLINRIIDFTKTAIRILDVFFTPTKPKQLDGNLKAQNRHPSFCVLLSCTYFMHVLFDLTDLSTATTNLNLTYKHDFALSSIHLNSVHHAESSLTALVDVQITHKCK